MTRLGSIVIVGGGLAGASAAFELRDRGFDGRMRIVAEESTAPYERPPLSKSYLRGESSLETALVRAAAEYETRGIELLAGRRATALDPVARRLGLDDGRELAFDAALIATGAAPRPLAAPGADLAGVHALRTVGDADAIRAAAETAGSIVVIGGGWIGTEVAASLRELGRAVTLITTRPRPLEGIVGPEVAEAYRALHADHGTRLVRGRVTGLEGEGRVRRVRLADGTRIPADLVIVGIGVVPRVELAAASGLAIIGGGIAVDEHLRTAAPTVYAVGDVATAWSPRFGRHLRVEHWDNAIRQGRTAAANILGAGIAYDRIPYFYSDQFDLGMEYRGYAPAWDRVVVHGDVRAREFLAFWLAGGRVVAAMNANRWDAADALAELVEAGETFDAEQSAGLPLVHGDVA